MKKIGCGIVSLPFVLIGFVILFEIFGMAVNHFGTWRQTEKLEKTVKKSFSDAQILDVYSETGNTSGTGNHVDMLSVVVFRTQEEYSSVEEKLYKSYPYDMWNCYLAKVAEMERERENYAPLYYEELDIPEDTDHCYLLYLCESAPFEDNIEGH